MGEKVYATGMTRREYMREYYRKNRDKIRSAQRDYYALKGSAIRERANSNRETLGWPRELKRFGISPEDYARMLAEQGGVCAICGEPPEGERLAVDHGHACCPGDKSCGKCVRGLLCRRCNPLLGLAKDSTATLSAAIKYLSERGTMCKVAAQ